MLFCASKCKSRSTSESESRSPAIPSVSIIGSAKVLKKTKKSSTFFPPQNPSFATLANYFYFLVFSARLHVPHKARHFFYFLIPATHDAASASSYFSTF